MKGLLVKDFRLVLAQKKYFIMVTLIGLALGLSNTKYFIFGYLIMVGAFFSISSINYDEMENGMQLLMSLPIKRSDYVKEKYLFSLILMAASAVVSIVIYIIGASIRHETVIISEAVTAVLGILFVMMIVYSLMMPFVISFGGEKGRVIAIGLVLVISFALMSTLNLSGTETAGAVSSVTDRLAAHETAGIAALFGAAIIAATVSIMISIRQIEKKEY